MSVAVEKLLVLKAYYLGHAISEKRAIVPVSLAMVDTAIDFLSSKQDEQSKLRHFFYVLLKAEILRGTDEGIECRKKAMFLSSSLPDDPYQDFMAIEDATQTKSKAYGIQQGTIGNKGVSHRKTFTYFVGSVPLAGVYDSALRALGLEESDLGGRDNRFLHTTTLKELLDKHNVPFNP